MPTTTYVERIAAACGFGRPSPAVRNGMPQSSTKAVPANGVVKCDQNARRVPGCAQAARMPTPVSIDERTILIAPVSVSTVTSAPISGG